MRACGLMAGRQLGPSLVRVAQRWKIALGRYVSGSWTGPLAGSSWALCVTHALGVLRGNFSNARAPIRTTFKIGTSVPRAAVWYAPRHATYPRRWGQRGRVASQGWASNVCHPLLPTTLHPPHVMALVPRPPRRSHWVMREPCSPPGRLLHLQDTGIHRTWGGGGGDTKNCIMMAFSAIIASSPN